jgi:hypothetical protein
VRKLILVALVGALLALPAAAHAGILLDNITVNLLNEPLNRNGVCVLGSTCDDLGEVTNS